MSTSLIKQLEDERRSTWHSAKNLLDHAAKNNRDLSGAEDAEYRRMNDHMDELDAHISELRAADERSKASDGAFSRLLGGSQMPGYRSAEDTELDRQFRNAILNRSYTPIDVAGVRRSGYQPGIEMRTAVGTSGNVGITFGQNLMTNLVDNTSLLRAGATVIQSDHGEPFKYPRATADSTAAITVEGAQIGESEPTISSVTLGAYKYAAMIYVTRELADDAMFDLLGYLGYEAGRAVGTAFGADTIVGTGTTKPRGVTLDAGSFVGATGSVGAFTADNLFDLYHSVGESYARSQSAAFVMNNATLALVRKLKDTQNRYLFSVDIPAGSGASGTLLGRPLFVSTAVDNPGLNKKPIIFGDMSRYVIRQVGGLRFERSDEFKFDTDVVAFRVVSRLDGALVDTAAVKTFTGASS